MFTRMDCLIECWEVWTDVLGLRDEDGWFEVQDFIDHFDFGEAFMEGLESQRKVDLMALVWGPNVGNMFRMFANLGRKL